MEWAWRAPKPGTWCRLRDAPRGHAVERCSGPAIPAPGPPGAISAVFPRSSTDPGFGRSRGSAPTPGHGGWLSGQANAPALRHVQRVTSPWAGYSRKVRTFQKSAAKPQNAGRRSRMPGMQFRPHPWREALHRNELIRPRANCRCQSFADPAMGPSLQPASRRGPPRSRSSLKDGIPVCACRQSDGRPAMSRPWRRQRSPPYRSEKFGCHSNHHRRPHN